MQGWQALKLKVELRWCIVKQGETKSNRIGRFKSKQDAEKEMKRQKTLPENAGYHFFVSMWPDDKKQLKGRTSSRRAGR